MLREYHNTLQNQLYTLSKLKTKNFNTFIKSAIILYDDIQVNPRPNSNLCHSCGKRVNKRSLCCNKSNMDIHKKCNNMRIFESGLCNKCKTFVVNRDFSTFSEDLPFHQVLNKETDHSMTSSNIKLAKQTFPENDPKWKVFKSKGLHFGHLSINSILPKIEQLRSLLVNSNISVLGITESKLDDTINSKEVEIDGYNLIQSNRNRKGGVIACYIKMNISFNSHGSLHENFKNILIDIFLAESKPINYAEYHL